MTVGTHKEIISYSNHEPNEVDFWKDWYDNIFSPELAKPKDVVAWGHGPCFSVSREIIHRHPRSVYEYLLERLTRPSRIFNGSKLNEVGVIYHNEIQRFYTIFFTHALPEANQYKIYNDTKKVNPKPSRFGLFYHNR